MGFSARVALLLLSAPGLLCAAVDTSPPEGLRENTPTGFVLVGAKIVAAPGRVIESGAVVIRDGKIASVTEGDTAPKGVRRVDVDGAILYPGFVDAYTAVEPAGDAPGPGYWNAQITPQRVVAASLKTDKDLNKELRSQGFTARLAAPSEGIIQGQSALVLTCDEEAPRAIVLESAALHVRLTVPFRGWGGPMRYPTSPMGAVALARQAMYDAAWRRDATAVARADPSVERPAANLALETLVRYLEGGGLVIASAPNELFAIRADQFAREFVLRLALVGSGNEYRRLEEIRRAGRPVIVPLDFPKPPDVASPEAAMNASLEELMHWRLAPENPGRLASAGVEIALTTEGLNDRGEFLERLRKAVKRGLDTDAALAALTTTPARLFGVEQTMGTIAPGMMANLVVADGDLFDPDTKLMATWVEGREYRHVEPPIASVLGDWKLQVADPEGTPRELTLAVTGEEDKPSATISDPNAEPDDEDAPDEAESGERDSPPDDATEVAGAVDEEGEDDESDEPKGVAVKPLHHSGYQLSGVFEGKTLGFDGKVTFTVTIVVDGDESVLTGFFRTADGRRLAVAGERSDETSTDNDDKKGEEEVEETEEDDDESQTFVLEANYPLGAYGLTARPGQETVAFTGATVWTCGAQGVVENATVLVEGGRIAAVGPDVAVTEAATTVDCRGKHLTPGIIDCHSHIATDGGINESGQAVTAEVRIGDCVDPDDITIYRQLAGGVTTANVLHGSANPIGGQNQVIKLRWGAGPRAMCFEGAPPGIKFALGENVKQSNWGDRFRTRYPQTRMGVDELMVDEFRAALDYRSRWRRWERDRTGLPPRRDLELDAIVDVLEHKRWIHCHSYRQSEILALLRTLESFGVRIGTLQHILEGYKLAPEMVEHGAMGSSFADWWAYKFEVYDAIPYNGALMHRAGVVVSFNSDDAELGRRLNLEAAKAEKYGGVPPQEALKFVTINPARQLRVEERVGSIEPGKDADLALWSGPPLSTRSRCEQTWIDGRNYFDLESDSELRLRDRQLHAKLVQAVLDSDEAPAKPGENRVDPSSLWPRYDEFCAGHDHGDRRQ